MSTTKKRDLDMLNGSISDKILRIALPLALTSILQQLFNSADMAVVGRFAGKEALAAVGANASLINMMVNMFVGLSVGANAMVSRHLGAGDHTKANQAAHAAVLIGLLSGAFLAIIGQVFPRLILQLISTPADILALATVYLRIYFAGMPFIMLYNFTAALFRSKGDTRTPMLALTTGGVVNVLLNLFFVLVCHMSVAGVGLATVIANVLSSCILLWKLMHMDGPLHISLRRLALPAEHVRSIAAIGIPAGLQGTIFSLSNVILQSAINALGTATIAANAAEVTYEFYIYYLISAFSQTNVTFLGQNLGAGKMDRCRKAALRSLMLSEACCLSLIILCVTFRHSLMRVFVSDPEIIRLGSIRFAFVIGTQWLNCAVDNLAGSLRGLGRSMIPAAICIAGICGFRLFWIFVIYPLRTGYSFLVLIYPVSWLITLTMMIIAAGIVFRHLPKGDALR